MEQPTRFLVISLFTGQFSMKDTAEISKENPEDGKNRDGRALDLWATVWTRSVQDNYVTCTVMLWCEKERDLLCELESGDSA